MISPPIGLLESWQSGQTTRKHTMHVHRRERISEHTWGLILVLLRYWPGLPKDTLVAAHLHDAGEGATADIPAHLCWEMPELKQAVEAKEKSHVFSMMPPSIRDMIEDVSPRDWMLIELADRAEFVLSCLHEFLMGNRLVEEPIRRAYGKLREVLAGLPEKTPQDNAVKAAGLQLRNDLSALLSKYGVQYD